MKTPTTQFRPPSPEPDNYVRVSGKLVEECRAFHSDNPEQVKAAKAWALKMRKKYTHEFEGETFVPRVVLWQPLPKWDAYIVGRAA